MAFVPPGKQGTEYNVDILVIGAGGMVGSKLIRHLCAAGNVGGQTIGKLVRHDVILSPPPPDSAFPVETLIGDLSTQGPGHGEWPPVATGFAGDRRVVEDLGTDVSQLGQHPVGHPDVGPEPAGSGRGRPPCDRDRRRWCSWPEFHGRGG